ncbi:DNA-binding transcriptional regulator, XRE-family HTH domain [Evansella caseinilytica]|uniref:DNA-binding transcriptional regulator, XRE-family HTH domain n=1 Tax=Evansella caseinilytica TaxID=1503961 RepID=A0A1H3TNZ6_9BACI|nr:helix-turn-helix transcriptional regulator [Evansella caseinilytica]SDZ51840.1 DNA-binding transcriptional regulator, XRE-family HTH domain [Evansella caseinilytica]
MNFGVNLQYLRMMHKNMTQEELANQLGVSRQTISKWELNQGNPELSKIKEICSLFNCKSDDLLFGNMKIVNDAYSEIVIESIEKFKYIKYTVISVEPEDDATRRIKQLARELDIDNPKIIGWDFAHLSQEQINVYHMHGYTSALVLPIDTKNAHESYLIEKRETQNYVTVTIKNPMDNPFHLISNAFKSVFQYIKVNRYTYDHFAFESVFYEDDVEYMRICVAIK